LAVEFSLT